MAFGDRNYTNSWANNRPNEWTNENYMEPVGKPQVSVSGTTRVKQEFLEDSKITTFLRRMEEARIPVRVESDWTYGDVSQARSLQDNLEAVAVAEQKFNDLPARIRGVAKNNVQTFLEMLNTYDDAVKLQQAGLDLGIEIPSSPSKPPNSSTEQAEASPSATEETS